jgi:hypothetical protein
VRPAIELKALASMQTDTSMEHPTMLNTTDMHTYGITAIDGPAGRVCDVYFDDEAWVVRYLAVETNGRARHQVLLPSVTVGIPDNAAKLFSVSLTREEVMNCPNVDTDKPVSRQYAGGRLGCYEYHPYWYKTGLGGPHSLSPPMSPEQHEVQPAAAESDETNTRCARADAEAFVDEHEHDNPHLRSANALTMYHLHATDGNIGRVQGLLVEEKTWAIRHLVVNTHGLMRSHLTLVAPERILEIDWTGKKIVVDLSRESIKSAPEYEHIASLACKSPVKT